MGSPALFAQSAATSVSATALVAFVFVSDKSPVGAISLSMAPSGKLLAVSGPGGLQVFQCIGSKPITHYTGALTKTAVVQSYWDNANHLYAIGGGKLYGFNHHTHRRNPGTQNLIAQPKTPRP